MKWMWMQMYKYNWKWIEYKCMNVNDKWISINIMEWKMNVIDMYGCKCNKAIWINVIKWKKNVMDMHECKW